MHLLIAKIRKKYYLYKHLGRSFISISKEIVIFQLKRGEGGWEDKITLITKI